jgi:23S rRNA pseudouridine1911/1915/1917 synthase
MLIVDKKFTPKVYLIKLQVETDDHGARLDQFALKFLHSFSREEVKKKIKSGDINILERDHPKRASVKVHEKEVVQIKIKITTHEDEYWRGEKLELETLNNTVYEDDELIIISKPPFMSTHPTGRHLFNCATVFFEEKFNKTIHSIHRLDRETSGILLLGKNPKSTQVITQSFEKNDVKKCYFFISKTSEENEKDEFIETSRLGASEEGLKRVYIDHYPEESSEGKSAETSFKIVYRDKNYALGLAFPKTGRQHQIRVHAMINKFPLLGDKLYLGNFKMFQRFKDNIALEKDFDLMEIHRHALHAYAINFPYQGKRQTFSAPLPMDLKNWIEKNLSISAVKLEEQLASELKNFDYSLNSRK